MATYYVDGTATSDGAGTLLSPWQRSQHIDANLTTGDTVLYRSATPATTVQSLPATGTNFRVDHTIDTYAADLAVYGPYIHDGAVAASTGWTLVAGKTNTYQRTQANSPQVRQVTQDYTATSDGTDMKGWLKVQTSINNVEATLGSYWHDTTNNLLYVSTMDGTDPTGHAMGVCASTGTQNGIVFRAVPAIRIKNFIVRRWGNGVGILLNGNTALGTTGPTTIQIENVQTYGCSTSGLALNTGADLSGGSVDPAVSDGIRAGSYIRNCIFGGNFLQTNDSGVFKVQHAAASLIFGLEVSGCRFSGAYFLRPDETTAATISIASSVFTFTASIGGVNYANGDRVGVRISRCTWFGRSGHPRCDLELAGGTDPAGDKYTPASYDNKVEDCNFYGCHCIFGDGSYVVCRSFVDLGRAATDQPSGLYAVDITSQTAGTLLFDNSVLIVGKGPDSYSASARCIGLQGGSVYAINSHIHDASATNAVEVVAFSVGGSPKFGCRQTIITRRTSGVIFGGGTLTNANQIESSNCRYAGNSTTQVIANAGVADVTQAAFLTDYDTAAVFAAPSTVDAITTAPDYTKQPSLNLAPAPGESLQRRSVNTTTAALGLRSLNNRVYGGLIGPYQNGVGPRGRDQSVRCRGRAG